MEFSWSIRFCGVYIGCRQELIVGYFLLEALLVRVGQPANSVTAGGVVGTFIILF